ncbi:hypothetical protein KCP69_08350 [Salmonella enterica subsp. enterica]|nr:hypothetical protein KCP69_08350 [Salmonella enterica subsp. enterica]
MMVKNGRCKRTRTPFNNQNVFLESAKAGKWLYD